MKRQTLENVRNRLSSLIKPYFDSGKILLSGNDDESTRGQGNVTLVNNPSSADHLSSKEINFDWNSTLYYSQKVKTADVYIEDTVEIDPVEFSYKNLRPWYYKGFLNRSLCRTLVAETPIQITLNGMPAAVAKHVIVVVLPETEYDALKQKVETDQYKRFRIAISGPAATTGGKAVSIGGRSWLEYTTEIFADNCVLVGGD